MQVIVHRGTRQIGGVATQISSASARILIDMGEVLPSEDSSAQAQLSVPGVTDNTASCDSVLFTHYHADHIGLLPHIRADIPIYMGALTKDILLHTLPYQEPVLRRRVEQARTFSPGQMFTIGDLKITPFCVDHSACDSYMFLIEAEGKRLLHTGDFRCHGFRGKAMAKLIRRLGQVDALITEGTALSRPFTPPLTESALQRQVRGYIKQYKYVFVLCASTNLERICALSKAVPRGKYFVCDAYQQRLLDLLQKHWGAYSPLYRHIKKTIYSPRLFDRLREKGFVMAVRDNQSFRNIIRRFDPARQIILYSMWEGYLRQPQSTLPAFLALAPHWEPLHTSGHASAQEIAQLVTALCPKAVIVIHTQKPQALQTLCPQTKVVLLQDKEPLFV